MPDEDGRVISRAEEAMYHAMLEGDSPTSKDGGNIDDETDSTSLLDRAAFLLDWKEPYCGMYSQDDDERSVDAPTEPLTDAEIFRLGEETNYSWDALMPRNGKGWDFNPLKLMYFNMRMLKPRTELEASVREWYRFRRSGKSDAEIAPLMGCTEAVLRKRWSDWRNKVFEEEWQRLERESRNMTPEQKAADEQLDRTLRKLDAIENRQMNGHMRSGPVVPITVMDNEEVD